MIVGDLVRFVRIAATLKRTGALDVALEGFGVPETRRKLLSALFWPLTPLGRAGSEDLPPVSRALSALGPSYVKFGQVISTREDIAGPALARDLRHLQDKLPPFDDDAARAIISAELGAPIDALFQRLDPPIAAASIAQVHPAVTRDGRKVAVKVLRPGIERAFKRDISGFYFVARVLELLRRKSRRLRPTDAVRHFEGVVTREMDLRLEAAAGSEYRDVMARGDARGFATPEMVWSLTSKRVLTSSWIEGDSLRDPAALAARGVDLPDLAIRLVRLFLTTALRDGYFHADMHQGNMKIGADGVVTLYDFGIMGRIDARTRRTYAEILYSYLTRDYRRGAQAHFDAGYVPRDRNLEQFAQALRSIGEPIVGRDARDISMGRVLDQLFEVTERFGMETRPELILLQRSMVVVEGVARTLDPRFNMWDAARPVVEAWMRENLGPSAVSRDLVGAVRSIARLGPRLPEFAERFVVAAEDWRSGGGVGALSARRDPPPAPARSGVSTAALVVCVAAAAFLGGL
ncbi:MAG: 2-polyprenylphenol 6-hydroxylase, partial [Pseudomonadota bacterium]